jgi:DNA-binding transcriptional LysR family regulator
MLDVKRMRVLREVAAQSSFSAAAEKLGYTQSAVSQQVAALERETGATLIERNPRGIRLTDAGEALVRHADAILARLADAEAELEAIADLRGGRLRMASFPTAGATLMPRAIAGFSGRHPAVELSMAELDPVDSLPRLRAGELDLVMVDDSSGVLAQDEFEFEHILDDPLHLALPKGHRLAERQRVRLEDLAEEPWIQPTSNCVCSVHTQVACAKAGFEPRVAYESDDFGVVQGLVAAGVGVALIPELALVGERPDIVVRRVGAKRQPFRQIYAATLANGYRSRALAEMLDILKETAAEYTPKPAIRAA